MLDRIRSLGKYRRRVRAVERVFLCCLHTFVGLKRTWDQKLSSGRSLISSSSVSWTLYNISCDIHPHSSFGGQVGELRLSLSALPSIGLRRTVVPVSLKKGWRLFQGVWTFFFSTSCRFGADFTQNSLLVFLSCEFSLSCVRRNFERTPQARSCKWTRVIRCATFCFFVNGENALFLSVYVALIW